MSQDVKKHTKDKVIFWLKIIGAVVAGVLSVLGVQTLSSCTSLSSFTISADSLRMDNANIEMKDSITFIPKRNVFR